MVRVRWRGALLWGAVGLGSLGPGSAFAFCRTTTAKQTQTSCPEPCVTTGTPLAWESPDLHYSLSQRGFPGLTEAQVRAIFAESFGAWEAVRCDGEPVGFEIHQNEQTTDAGVGPESRFPEWNVNTMVLVSTQEEWADNDLPSLAFAVTGVWFTPSTGHIVGADTQFNGGMSRFGICPDEGCPADGRTVDLRNVATHEAGHFLGLAHSEDPNATMWCGADPTDVSKRDLADDDIEGLCAAYPPGAALLAGPPTVRSAGCALGSTRASSGWPLWLALGLGLRRRTRSRAR
ncbi:MAG TPA: matrixin family metalloprotease [Polyangiaceae bacterium]|nr:matrixin family metalloprotease [Polyangiaceae bacterium]